MLSKSIKQLFATTTSQNLYGLSKFGIKNRRIAFNLSTPQLYESGFQHWAPADPTIRPPFVADSGAIVAYSGERMGRSPTDQRIVLDDFTKERIWWGKVNIPISPQSNKISEDIAINYLNTRPRVYILDGYAGWDIENRIKVRVVCTRAYHALFMKNMLIKPTPQEIQRDFIKSSPDFHIFNAGEVHLPHKFIDGLSSPTSVQVNFKERTMSIFGTQYAGEMKKGVFTIMNYLMPLEGHLSMHASATEGAKGDVTVLFGLSGTGKTTLSADPNRLCIGDDEHVWNKRGIFNIEGGCYAKCVNLTEEKEPDIFRSIKFGAILENVEMKDNFTREIDYTNISLTENTRCSYPLEHLPNAQFPAMGAHPSNIIFLTCDAYGVLPPISKLTPEQAMYHFLSGYTAKVAGTEVGVKQPTATFSPCFGQAFLPLHPTVYGELLAEKIRQYKTNVWLINTGWSGGKYGDGKRMDLQMTRKIVDAIHEGELARAEFNNLEVFNLKVPTKVPGVPDSVLIPKNTWSNKQDYDATIRKLGDMFKKNFKKFEDKASPEVLAAGPVF